MSSPNQSRPNEEDNASCLNHEEENVSSQSRTAHASASRPVCASKSCCQAHASASCPVSASASRQAHADTSRSVRASNPSESRPTMQNCRNDAQRINVIEQSIREETSQLANLRAQKNDIVTQIIDTERRIDRMRSDLMDIGEYREAHNNKIRSFLGTIGKNVDFNGSQHRLEYSFGDLVSVRTYIGPYMGNRGRPRLGTPHIGYVVRETNENVFYILKEDLENNNPRAGYHKAGKQNTRLH